MPKKTPQRRRSSIPPPELKAASGVNPIVHKPEHAYMANGLNTILPIVHPLTGEEMPIFDRRTESNFKKSFSAEAMVAKQDIINRIKDLTGIRRLRDLAKLASSDSPKKRAAIDETRQRILNSLEFLDKYRTEAREDGLSELGEDANDYVQDIIETYFPSFGYKYELGIKNEVETCNDAATLLFMAFDTRLDTRLRYEARRKLALMELIGNIKNHKSVDEDRNQSLGSMVDFLNRKMYTTPEDTKIGSSSEHYLVSKHAKGKERECKEAEIKEREPKVRRALTKITRLSLRRAVVSNEESREREIECFTASRKKTWRDRLTKMLRFGEGVGEEDDDINGIRMIFNKQEDWSDFFSLLQIFLKEEIRENLKRRLEEDDTGEKEKIQERIDNIDSAVKIDDIKDNLQGNRKFDGRSRSSSDEMKFLKFNLHVNRANDLVQNYEFQIFLPDGFADYMYRKGMSWEEFRVKRFFDENVDELLFPSAIYPTIDRKEVREYLMKTAYDKIWKEDETKLDKQRRRKRSKKKN